MSRLRARWRWVATAGGALVLVAAVWFLFMRATPVEPDLTVALPVATVGSGDEAVGVTAEGILLVSQAPPAAGTLPALPSAEPPKGGRLGGPMLAQAHVLGAAPAAVRPCIASSRYGETGVDVELDSGIELRFGDASRAVEKWRSAVAVLADPSITTLDYVDLHAPGRPAVHGEGHVLPSAGEGSDGGCDG